MNTCKLIFRNVCKNIRDYLIYFLTLTLSVSLFYAFNSISDQPAFSNMGMTGTLLYRQLGIMLSTLSTMIAVVLAFLILYTAATPFAILHSRFENGTDFIAGVLSVPLVHDVQERSKVIVCGIGTIHIVIDGDKPNAL